MCVIMRAKMRGTSRGVETPGVWSRNHDVGYGEKIQCSKRQAAWPDVNIIPFKVSLIHLNEGNTTSSADESSWRDETRRLFTFCSSVIECDFIFRSWILSNFKAPQLEHAVIYADKLVKLGRALRHVAWAAITHTMQGWMYLRYLHRTRWLELQYL